MPDTTFSWRSLREHLRKYLWLYLLGIALGLLGAELLWTMTRPRIPSTASVNIYMAAPYSNPEPLEALAEGTEVPVEWVCSMKELGQACGIAVGAAAAGILAQQRTPGL